jgi:biopolymer transport protein ExbD
MRKRRDQGGGGHESSTGIDLAPMLDFVINLLIFFITAVFVKESGLR